MTSILAFIPTIFETIKSFKNAASEMKTIMTSSENTTAISSQKNMVEDGIDRIRDLIANQIAATQGYKIEKDKICVWKKEHLTQFMRHFIKTERKNEVDIIITEIAWPDVEGVEQMDTWMSVFMTEYTNILNYINEIAVAGYELSLVDPRGGTRIGNEPVDTKFDLDWTALKALSYTDNNVKDNLDKVNNASPVIKAAVLQDGNTKTQDMLDKDALNRDFLERELIVKNIDLIVELLKELCASKYVNAFGMNTSKEIVTNDNSTLVITTKKMELYNAMFKTWSENTGEYGNLTLFMEAGYLSWAAGDDYLTIFNGWSISEKMQNSISTSAFGTFNEVPGYTWQFKINLVFATNGRNAPTLPTWRGKIHVHTWSYDSAVHYKKEYVFPYVKYTGYNNWVTNVSFLIGMGEYATIFLKSDGTAYDNIEMGSSSFTLAVHGAEPLLIPTGESVDYDALYYYVENETKKFITSPSTRWIDLFGKCYPTSDESQLCITNLWQQEVAPYEVAWNFLSKVFFGDCYTKYSAIDVDSALTYLFGHDVSLIDLVPLQKWIEHDGPFGLPTKKTITEILSKLIQDLGAWKVIVTTDNGSSEFVSGILTPHSFSVYEESTSVKPSLTSHLLKTLSVTRDLEGARKVIKHRTAVTNEKNNKNKKQKNKV